jgi:hypothetical protein
LDPFALWPASNRRWGFWLNDPARSRRTRLDFRWGRSSGRHAQRFEKTPDAFFIAFLGLGLAHSPGRRMPFWFFRRATRLLCHPAKDQRDRGEDEKDENVGHPMR